MNQDALYYHDVDIGDEIGSIERVVTLDQVRAFLAIHGGVKEPNFFTDDAHAKSVGLPGAIVPGAFNSAMLAQLLTSWSPTVYLKKFEVIFRHPVHHNTELELKGVITASAGNHAQGVALAAKKLHLKATIVMPTTTPDIKVGAVRSYGAKAVLHGENFDAAKDYCLQLAKKEGLAFIHPFDDYDVMAGQGTIAHEIIRQQPDSVDVIFVPVGGGGLLGGIVGFIKAVKPSIKVVGVEPEDAPGLSAFLADGTEPA